MSSRKLIEEGLRSVSRVFGRLPPLVGAYAQDWQADPWSRLAGTLRSYLRIVYGTADAARGEIRRLNQLHKDISGPRYRARDPELSLWVHATLVDSTIAVYEDVIKRAWRGVVDSKHETMSEYTFAITYENMELEGWINEKIFDAFLVGTVPIFRGAPDVTDYIPEECFIDARRFGDYRELESYLRSQIPRNARQRAIVGLRHCNLLKDAQRIPFECDRDWFDGQSFI
jgi:hypothetical protein